MTPFLFPFYKIVAEFERILGIETSILASFRDNFSQAATPLTAIGKAKENKRNAALENICSSWRESSRTRKMTHVRADWGRLTLIMRKQ